MQLMDTHLTHKVPPIICSRRQIQKFSDNFKFFCVFQNNRDKNAGRRFSLNIIPYFFRKMSQNLSSAAVVIGALRVLMYVAVCNIVL